MNQQPATALSAHDLRAWLTTYLSQLLALDPSELSPSTPFESYGLDSSAAVGMSGDLGDLLGTELDASLAYDFPSIDALVEHLVGAQRVTRS